MKTYRTIINESNFLSHLTNVIGSTMGQLAVESKLRNDWMIQNMKYVEFVEDDEYVIHNMTRQRKILFINGVALELELFFEILWEIDMGDPHSFNGCKTYDFVEKDSNIDRLFRFCVDKKMMICVFQENVSRSSGSKLVSWGVTLMDNFVESTWYKQMQKSCIEDMPVVKNELR